MKIEIADDLYQEILLTCAEESNTTADKIEIEKITFNVDLNADVEYKVFDEKFERIRRITGE